MFRVRTHARTLSICLADFFASGVDRVDRDVFERLVCARRWKTTRLDRQGTGHVSGHVATSLHVSTRSCCVDDLWSVCLGLSILLFFVYSQKVGRRVEHHLSKRDRCSQKEGLLSCFGCARCFFFFLFQAVPLSRSHVACRVKKKDRFRDWRYH